MTTITCPRCGKKRPVIIFGSGPIAVCDCDPWHVVIYEGKKPMNKANVSLRTTGVEV